MLVAIAAVVLLGPRVAWRNDAIAGAVIDFATLVGLLRSTWLGQIERNGAKGA